MTKIDIISGFLGAGKTTFIKKMIDEVFKGEKIVLIENEFGEVGIDGGFLKDAGIQITEMNSGCICCSLVGDFGKNLHEVIDKYHPDRILIEPSGVGKLSDVMKSVIDIEKEEDVKLNGLVTVVNALKASKQMKAFGEFFNNQIEYATVVVLSRSQNATPEQLELCVKQIQTLNPKAAIITTAWDAIKGEQILKVIEGADSLEMKLMAEQHAKEEAEEHEHEHHHHDHDHEHDHEHHHEHDENCTCGCHDHDHEHEHDHDHEHHHDHDHEHHHHHEHRNLYDVNTIIDNSSLDENTKDLAKRIFLRVAKAESKVHNKSLDEVHFHEVGAIDSIVDIVGTAILINKINPDRIISSVVNDGYGFIECAHGTMAVPVPATSEIFAASNVKFRQIDIDTELVTPTGAAIIAELAEDFTTLPAMVTEKIGWGTGSKDLKIPNVLKVYYGEMQEENQNVPSQESIMSIDNQNEPYTRSK